jgi:chemotaxis protein methyltransferase CheR
MSATAPADTNHLASLSRSDFNRLADFIHQATGIKMPPSKHSMVEGRLRRRLAATGAPSFAEYCARVFDSGEDGAEIVHLLDAITTNKTDFFREPDHFRLLTDIVLPQMAQQRRKLKFWSAACSVGAEPYTLAMVASEFTQTPRAGAVPVQPPMILATDLSSAVLKTALAGIYPAEMVETVPPPLRKRYLMRSKDPSQNTVRVVPSLRAMVRFGRLNLMAPQYGIDTDFDVIFCRNVLIYFDRNDQAAVLRRLCDHLRPGGVLALGHSETINGLDLPVVPIGHTMFRRN